MSSEDRFSHPGKVQPGDVFRVFRNHSEPVLSTTDINREIDWASRSTVHRQLIDMRESGQLRSKKAGEQDNAGEVWYPPDEIKEIPRPTPGLLKLIYQHPWYSLLASGFFVIAFGFVLFVPGYFGQGRYLGLINREWLVLASIFLYVSGIIMASIAGGLIIARDVWIWIRR